MSPDGHAYRQAHRCVLVYQVLWASRHEHRSGRTRGGKGEAIIPCVPRHRPRRAFPDYVLPDHTGTVCTLSELQDRDPLILTVAR
jgi:hypothetical protein